MRSLLKKLLPKQVLALLKQVRYFWIVSLFHVFHLCPIKPRRVVLCNVWGFGDNAKYVTEELAKRKLKLDIVFVTNNPDTADAPEGVVVLKSNTIKAIMAQATARVWLDNNRKENYIRKRKGQFYIQTWHGGIALKKIEKDYEKLSSSYVANAKRDSAMTDLYISNSTFCTNMYRNSFWYHGEILECGSPRNDILINPTLSQLTDIRKRLGVKANVKIAIYAPTYREDNDTKAYQLDCNKLLSILEYRFGGEWVIAVRLHPLVSEQSTFLHYSKQVLNASHYRDIYELMAISELMITDYSNIMFEFSFMKKAVFLYAADEAEYTMDRGFYFDYPSLPYDKANTEEELFAKIKQYQEDVYLQRLEEFFYTLTIFENGDASKQVADRIVKVIGFEEGM